jgi:hypothetical protein
MVYPDLCDDEGRLIGTYLPTTDEHAADGSKQRASRAWSGFGRPLAIERVSGWNAASGQVTDF